ncbi:MAG TPA: acyltransferase [Microcella sp.]|nr:acyltransferase [Microcella sp.]
MTSRPPVPSRLNNFDVLRLGAALLVVGTHSFAVVAQPEPASILDASRGTWGHFGVLIFFSISGYLIAQSWQRDPLAGRYMLKRASRIFPALAVMTVITAAVFGPLTTDVTLREYVASPNTWLYPIVKTALFVPGNVDPPGIFHAVPYDGVNPSLWTLPVEFTCYTVLMIVLLTRVPPLVATIALTVGATALSEPALWAATPLAGLTANALFSQSILVMATFFGGAALYLARARIPLHAGVAALALIALVLVGFTPWGGLAVPFLMPYVVLSAALALPVLPLGRLRGWDLSYAVYLYGFPVQQYVVHLTQTDSALVVFILATVALIPIAALSWRYVEKPALEWGRRRLRRVAEATA